ncbi:hypothetical protein BH24ACT9_BH24ACT9_08130 [soil metagenome]
MNSQPPNQGQPAQPEGPLPNATAGRSALWPVAVAVLALVVAGVSFWMGTYLAVYRHTGISFYLFIAAIGGALGGPSSWATAGVE